MRLGALEAGGTKMVCAICDENGNVSDRVSIPTTTPAETMPKLQEYFRDKNVDCLGIACFGPIDLRENSDTYGYITTTPKAGWANTDVVGAFKELGVPVGFDVDVNGSVLGEVTFGIGKGKNHVIYITIGTGLGVGVYQEGKLLHGMQHPEGGHILLPIHPKDPMKRGVCPFHPNCLEGLASGTSVRERWGKGGQDLVDRDEVWDLEAFYLATALVSYTAILSPELIILGGGMMHQSEQILPRVHAQYKELLNGYIKTEQTMKPEEYIVCQSLNDNQGILGAAMLGLQAMKK